jgi:hypothetical protein
MKPAFVRTELPHRQPGNDIIDRKLVQGRVGELAVIPAVPDADAASPRLLAQGHRMIVSPGRHAGTRHADRILTEMAQTPDRRQII